ncbi:MAG: 8-oxo-dGTP diphosphatase [Planctomycetes bacterium]|nr:8-oxo-dGTP diphosphatase [Planctomycetota bacterium]
MPFTPTLATLGYVLSPDAAKVLLIHRNTRPDDAHFGKYNGLGGKLDAGEDIVAGMRREIREEAGIVCTSLRLRGTISWPGFGKQGDDWFGFIFIIDAWTGSANVSNAEGTLEWVAIEEMQNLPLWEGDRYFLPLVFDDKIKQFHGVMPYRDGRPLTWSYSVLGD